MSKLWSLISTGRDFWSGSCTSLVSWWSRFFILSSAYNADWRSLEKTVIKHLLVSKLKSRILNSRKRRQIKEWILSFGSQFAWISWNWLVPLFHNWFQEWSCQLIFNLCFSFKILYFALLINNSFLISGDHFYIDDTIELITKPSWQ